MNRPLHEIASIIDPPLPRTVDEALYELDRLEEVRTLAESTDDLARLEWCDERLEALYSRLVDLEMEGPE